MFNYSKQENNEINGARFTCLVFSIPESQNEAGPELPIGLGVNLKFATESKLTSGTMV